MPYLSLRLDTGAAQGKITIGVVIRVRHQHQVGLVAFHRAQLGQWVVRPDVAVDYEEWGPAQQGQGVENAAARLEGAAGFARIVNIQSPAAAVTEVFPELIAQVSQVDHDFTKAA